MSTGQECALVEARPGQWYLLLESYEDYEPWEEYADAYGPFATKENTVAFLHRNFANPGGYWEVPYDEKCGPDPFCATIEKVIKDAPENVRALRPNYAPYRAVGY